MDGLGAAGAALGGRGAGTLPTDPLACWGALLGAAAERGRALGACACAGAVGRALGAGGCDGSGSADGCDEGDFAAVMRRMRFGGSSSTSIFLSDERANKMHVEIICRCMCMYSGM